MNQQLTQQVTLTLLHTELLSSDVVLSVSVENASGGSLSDTHTVYLIELESARYVDVTLNTVSAYIDNIVQAFAIRNTLYVIF